MFIRSLLIAGMALLAPTICLGAPPLRMPVTAAINEVTVYQDRALVTRNASLSLKPGSYLIALEHLPVLLQDDSVRVEGSGSARVTIAGIEVKRRFLEQSAEKRAKEIEGEIRTLERKTGAIDARQSGLSAQKAFLESIRVAWSERISKELAIGKPTAAELLDAAAFVANGVAKADDQSRELDVEKRLLREKIDALRRQLQETVGSRRKETKTVEVALEVTKAGSFSLNLSGMVTKATWEPAYDVRLSADGVTAELTFRAVVRQQTGEDWNNVALTLSTARPVAGGAPPELHPWRIGFYRPMPAALAAPAPRAESLRYKKSARVAELQDNLTGSALPEEAAVDAEFQTAQVAAEATSISFRIPKTVDVTADNSQQSVVVAQEKLAITTEYVAIPKLTQSVYLTAELINKAAYPLLPGQIRIFTGNTFIGTAGMKKVASGEKFSLPFGSDDQITVTRDGQRQHKEAGLFGKNRMGYRYTLEAHNFRKEAQTISIKDQLPLAGDQEIKVSLEDAGMQPTEKKEDGTLLWKLKLGPGEKKRFSYEIVVEYPKDREVSGL